MAKLPISLKYFNLLLGPPLEWNPKLYIWCANVDKRGWSTSFPIEFDKNEKSNESINHKVEIPLGDPSLLSAASMIGFQLRADTISETGVITTMEIANKLFPIQQIYKGLIRDEKFQHELPLTITGYHEKLDKEVTETKGKLHIFADRSDLKNLKEWNFSPLDPYQQIVLNSDMNIKALNLIATKAMAPFVNQSLKSTLPEIEGINVPVYTSEIGIIPSKVFWINNNGLKVDEQALEHLFKLELENANITTDKFSMILENQFQSDSALISKDFFDCLQIYSKTLSSISLSVSYLSDQFFSTASEKADGSTVKKRVKRKLNEEEKKSEEPQKTSLSMQQINEIHKKYSQGIETFRDPMNFGSKPSGDCEDVVKPYQKLSHLLELGDEKYKSSEHPWTVNGGFKSRLLSNIQRVAFMYVPFDLIGTVAGKYPGDESNDSMKEEKIKINSEKFNQAEVGGHAFGTLCPVSYLEKMISKTSDYDEEYHLGKIMNIKNNIRNRNVQMKELEELIKHTQGISKESLPLFFKDFQTPKWSHSLPVLLVEGTGFISPMYIPPKDVWRSQKNTMLNPEEYEEEIKKNAEASEISRQKLIKATSRLKNSQFFAASITETCATMEEDKDDLIIGSFYRFIGRAYTDKFHKYGIPIDEMLFIERYKPDRKSVFNNKNFGIGDAPGNTPQPKTESEWSYGVHMKDLFYKRDWVSVLILPVMSEDERQIARATMDFLPPLKNFEFGQNEETERIYRPVINQLNEECKQRYGNFDKIEAGENEYLHTFYMEKDYFLNEELREDIMEDLHNNPYIKNISFHFDHLTNEISRLRIRALVDLSDDSKKEKRLKKRLISSNFPKRVHILPKINAKTGAIKHVPVAFEEEDDYKSFLMGLLESKPEKQLHQREKRFYDNGKEFTQSQKFISYSLGMSSKRHAIQSSFLKKL